MSAVLDWRHAESEAPLKAARRLACAFAHDAARHDADGSFPFANFKALHQAGLLNLTVRSEEGGGEAALDETWRVVSTIAGGDASTALVLAMHLVNHAVIARGHIFPPDLANLLVRASRADIALVNRLQVEPVAGSPSYGALPQTKALRAPGGWRISGSKRFCTGAPMLAWLLVSAVTDDPEPRLGSFAISGDAVGVDIVETWDMIGMRASGSHDMIFENVFVPENRSFELVPASQGVRRDDFTGAWFMTLIGAVYHA